MKSLLYKLGAVGVILTLTYVLGHQVGQASSERQRAVDRAGLVAQNKNLSDQLKTKTADFDKSRKENEDAIRKLEDAHERTLADVGRDAAVRLRNSEARAGVYQRLSQAGTAEREHLAAHAAQLDRTLEEGRHLVAELRETLGHRDGQLKLLSRELFATRELMGAKNASADHQSR